MAVSPIFATGLGSASIDDLLAEVDFQEAIYSCLMVICSTCPSHDKELALVNAAIAIKRYEATLREMESPVVFVDHESIAMLLLQAGYFTKDSAQQALAMFKISHIEHELALVQTHLYQAMSMLSIKLQEDASAFPYHSFPSLYTMKALFLEDTGFRELELTKEMLLEKTSIEEFEPRDEAKRTAKTIFNQLIPYLNQPQSIPRMCQIIKAMIFPLTVKQKQWVIIALLTEIAQQIDQLHPHLPITHIQLLEDSIANLADVSIAEYPDITKRYCAQQIERALVAISQAIPSNPDEACAEYQRICTIYDPTGEISDSPMPYAGVIFAIEYLPPSQQRMAINTILWNLKNPDYLSGIRTNPKQLANLLTGLGYKLATICHAEGDSTAKIWTQLRHLFAAICIPQIDADWRKGRDWIQHYREDDGYSTCHQLMCNDVDGSFYAHLGDTSTTFHHLNQTYSDSLNAAIKAGDRAAMTAKKNPKECPASNTYNFPTNLIRFTIGLPVTLIVIFWNSASSWFTPPRLPPAISHSPEERDVSASPNAEDGALSLIKLSGVTMNIPQAIQEFQEASCACLLTCCNPHSSPLTIKLALAAFEMALTRLEIMTRHAEGAQYLTFDPADTAKLIAQRLYSSYEHDQIRLENLNQDLRHLREEKKASLAMHLSKLRMSHSSLESQRLHYEKSKIQWQLREDEIIRQIQEIEQRLNLPATLQQMLVAASVHIPQSLMSSAAYFNDVLRELQHIYNPPALSAPAAAASRQPTSVAETKAERVSLSFTNGENHPAPWREGEWEAWKESCEIRVEAPPLMDIPESFWPSVDFTDFVLQQEPDEAEAMQLTEYKKALLSQTSIGLSAGVLQCICDQNQSVLEKQMALIYLALHLKNLNETARLQQIKFELMACFNLGELQRLQLQECILSLPPETQAKSPLYQVLDLLQKARRELLDSFSHESWKTLQLQSFKPRFSFQHLVVTSPLAREDAALRRDRIKLLTALSETAYYEWMNAPTVDLFEVHLRETVTQNKREHLVDVSTIDLSNLDTIPPSIKESPDQLAMLLLHINAQQAERYADFEKDAVTLLCRSLTHETYTDNKDRLNLLNPEAQIAELKKLIQQQDGGLIWLSQNTQPPLSPADLRRKFHQAYSLDSLVSATRYLQVWDQPGTHLRQLMTDHEGAFSADRILNDEKRTPLSTAGARMLEKAKSLAPAVRIKPESESTWNGRLLFGIFCISIVGIPFAILGPIIYYTCCRKPRHQTQQAPRLVSHTPSANLARLLVVASQATFASASSIKSPGTGHQSDAAGPTCAVSGVV